MDLREYEERPTNRQREKVIEQLKSNFAHDIIDVHEYEHRLDIATNAHNNTELINLVKDLEPVKNTSTPAATSTNVNRNTGRVRDSQTFLTIFSGITRKGKWSPARNSQVFCAFGGADLDFREAKFPPGTTTVSILCLFGGVDIIVPPEVRVECNGFAIFGGFDDQCGDSAEPDAPVLKINGFVAFGGVDVKEKKRR
jgi:hypothetical protein